MTNVPVTVMPAAEVITKYHDLWHIEKSFRMSKSDLDARPMFNRMRDAVEAHLTIVFTALAVAHAIQSRTGLYVVKIVKQLRPLRSATPSTSTVQRRPFRRRSPTPSARSSPISASTLGTKRNVQTQVRSRGKLADSLLLRRSSSLRVSGSTTAKRGYFACFCPLRRHHLSTVGARGGHRNGARRHPCKRGSARPIIS